ncbi:hypothetical protein TNCT_110761 [Trichonephila clavata]|uniref:Peptidase aspartic putative domain-containing protein n=1 Tax=Trichonephila clavata TaxID=2740835 RepID=A0A8X6FFE0_TRICU|nr:hypothetical protein TNCT_110761 [Trichonephila clavata]
MLLDCGSSKSFVSENIANTLKLKQICRDVLTIYSFGMEKDTEQIFLVVEFQLRKQSTCFCKCIQALVINQILGALVRGVDKHVAQFTCPNGICSWLTLVGVTKHQAWMSW